MKYKILLFTLSLAITCNYLKAQDTFSIVAVDTITGEVGSAGASCVDLDVWFSNYPDDFLGKLLPGVGAINTQASYNQTNQNNARIRMESGDSPNQIIQWLINNDVTGQPQRRQYGIAAIIGTSSETAAYTGSLTNQYRGHITGPNYSIQGNILKGQDILDSMEENFLQAEGDLACRLMAALQGANVIGADTRCAANKTSSLFSFIKVAKPDDTFGSPSFLLSVRTSANDEIEPIDSLQILFDMYHNCLTTQDNSYDNNNYTFSVFPNPADNSIYLETYQDYKYYVIIRNLAGIIVYENEFYNNANVDISFLSKGIYFIKLFNENQSYKTKFLKK